MRQFEEAVAREVEEGNVAGMAHLSVGQEGVAAGVGAALRPGDFISGTHRAHGHCLARGADPRAMMAEIFGKETGLCRGRGGSLHVVDASLGIIGANGIVGAQNLLAVGAALSAKIRQSGQVSVSFLGDASTNIGFFHEAMNLAALWSLPVLFVCENNGYGVSTPQERHTRVRRLADRVQAYAMPAQTVAGDDPAAVYQAAREAVELARRGEGPTFLEVITHRWRGHYEGDLDDYRTRQQKAAERAIDPIINLERELKEAGLISDEEARRMAKEARAMVLEALQFARSSPEPDPAELLRDVYAPEPPELVMGPTTNSRSSSNASSLSADPDGPAAPATPETSTERWVTMSEAIREALREEMQRDPRVILLGEDIGMGFFGVTTGLLEEFGSERVRDTPISENAIAGSAVGAAMTGLRPVAEIMFEDFLTACFDPVVNQAAKLRYMSGGQYQVPLVLRTPGGAGLAFAAQHSQSLEALFMHIPGLLVAVPSTPADAKGLMKSAIRSNNPVLFFEHKLLYFTDGPISPGDHVLPFGVAEVKRPGRDATVVAILAMVPLTLEAASELAEEEGIDVEVLDPRTLVPLDQEAILTSVARTGRVLVVEEGCRTGGVGAEIAALVSERAFTQLKAPVQRLAAPDVPIPFSKVLENATIPDKDRIKEAIRHLVQGTGHPA
ncbi:MAG: dehydrogenase E1 component subunit alpha/beta [Firmicutes bacterium]|nr:dehydrogenase E1 component subunit alpha/beta [Bacillota bacterium]